jgi:hypothetical protein
VILCHEHRYVFVELPRTGCTAVGKELIHSYAGTRVLAKHSTYQDFLRQASDEEARYFAFSSIRNPMDDAVSGYFKLKTDHHGRYTDPDRRKYRVGNRGADSVRSTGLNARGLKPKRRAASELRDNRRFDFIQRNGSDFAEYFMRYYRAPYDTWSRVSHPHMDFVIRFEQLESDFEQVLSLIGLEQRRPLPLKNKTESKSGDFLTYFTPPTRSRAVQVFGPYMERFGYPLPPEWGEVEVPAFSRLAYNVLSLPRQLYWKFVR